jgi:hypothetical protein
MSALVLVRLDGLSLHVSLLVQVLEQDGSTGPSADYGSAGCGQRLGVAGPEWLAAGLADHLGG